MEKFEQPGVPIDKQLESLFGADQKDRLEDKLDETNLSLLDERDANRLKQAEALFLEYQKDPQKFSAESVYYLAFLFHHGRTTEDYEKALALFQEADRRGEEGAKEMTELAEDRLLLSQGKSQKFGTQQVIEDSDPKKDS